MIWKKNSWYCPFRLPGKVLSLDRLHASDPEPAGPGVHPLVDAVHVVAPVSHILKQETTTFKVVVLFIFGGFSHFSTSKHMAVSAEEMYPLHLPASFLCPTYQNVPDQTKCEFKGTSFRDCLPTFLKNDPLPSAHNSSKSKTPFANKALYSTPGVHFCA